MGRHTESNNVILLAIKLKVGRVVAFMAVKDKQPICSSCTTFSMLVKVLNPFQASFIGRPAVVANSDAPIHWQLTAFVPGREVEFAGNDNERRDRPPLGADAPDHRNPFSITLLCHLGSSTPLGPCDYHPCRRNDAHHEARLVKVVDVPLLDAMIAFVC